ncbi:hypothetical protein EDD15DRAFT_2198362 [Pisolithus albus]|nr:hypothetical protein EDD15DRAFT_2198362 [Pisolithus albus]
MFTTQCGSHLKRAISTFPYSKSLTNTNYEVIFFCEPREVALLYTISHSAARGACLYKPQSCSLTLLQITSADDEADIKLAIPHLPGTSKSMLPEEISIQFQEVFIPTLLAYCGIIPNLWNLPHLCGFVGAAEKVTAAWFHSDEFSDDESRGAWAEWAIDAQLGFPFVFQYMKLSRNHGVGAFHVPLILQTLACHYTKTVNVVSCPQINVYPHGALTLATAVKCSWIICIG